MYSVEVAVVGAGVVGLAIARRLSSDGLDVVVLEAEGDFGLGVSSRSSEVIHGGLYYPENSLKARLCVEGRRRLYAYCAERSVPHARLGKLIVATSDAQCAALDALERQAEANGVEGMSRWSLAKVRESEPDLRCVAALHSHETGIVDSRSLMRAFVGDIETSGGAVAFGAPLAGASAGNGEISVRVGGRDPTSLVCRILINAAGLGAEAVARSIDGLEAAHIPTTRYAQGAYFTLSGARAPFNRLVYPVPEPGGLGVHLTLDLGGQARFGPDVLWIDTPHYRIEPERADRFYGAIRTYWPSLPDGALQPSYAAVRPKISGPGEPAADFRIDGPAETGGTGVFCLYGIESPGLTSSLAIAEEVGLRVRAL